MPYPKKEGFVDILIESAIFSILLICVAGYLILSINPNYNGRVDLLTVSISLAGFVLVGALFDTKNKKRKSTLFNTSKWLIYAAISFIIFYVVTPFLQSSDYFIIAVSFLVAAIGTFFFTIGILNLLKVIKSSKVMD